MTNTETCTIESFPTVSETILALQKEEEKKQKKRAHLFKKGEVANPKGRRKGSKNKLTLLRQAVLDNAEEMVLENWEKLVLTTIELAEAGDSTALKILWDRVIPSKRAVDINHNNADKMKVTINIGSLETKSLSAEVVEEDIEEAEIIDGT